MHPSTVTIRSGETTKELSYTCFPVKLFRLVSDEKYSSLWWSETGNHFVVDVPRFEQEILRNDSVPEADGFKTITFTSFIRQLNLYGFRKVTLDSDKHVDPRDWQRYAHAFFIRGRMDYLDRIKRQVASSQTASRCDRGNSLMAEAMRGYNTAVSQHFRCRGMRPSRKGPKPKYRPLRALRHYKSRRNQLLQASALQSHVQPGQFVPAYTYASMQSYVAPVEVQTIPITQFVGNVWNNVQFEGQLPSTNTIDAGQSGEGCSKKIAPVAPPNVASTMSPDMWQNYAVTLSPQCLNEADMTSMCTEAFPQNPSYLVEPSTLVTDDVSLLASQEENKCSADSYATNVAQNFDIVLNAELLGDAVTLAGSPQQYCIINDVNNMTLWQDEGDSPGANMLADQFLVCNNPVAM
ncbi:uncharacterized protein LOC143466162 [Clavelina lepadiformis]|uniref:uncharacterized protein LOC143466162 n=1 Tax=Clavelina lepadiformis TaxID=159417 RepID=UPI004043490C